MAKRSVTRAKMHANRVMMHKRAIAPVEHPDVVRERSQRRYKDTPKRRSFELFNRAAIVRRHGIAALDLRLAIMNA